MYTDVRVGQTFEPAEITASELLLASLHRNSGGFRYGPAETAPKHEPLLYYYLPGRPL